VTETNVFQLSQPGTFVDPLTEVLRNGARALLAQAVEAEVAALLIIGATPEGKKELVGLIDGVRESAQSWKAPRPEATRACDRARARSRRWRARLLAGDRGSVAHDPRPALLGAQTANVLNKLPKSQQSKGKRALQEIWMAESKKDALAAFDAFVETWSVKYDKATKCLIKDRDALLAFVIRRPLLR
jgi:hypothetical protein